VRLLEYFAEMEAKHGVVVNERQKAWYYAKEKTLGDDMKREYPTIPAEAFQQSVEGAYYAKQFRWLYTNKRIGKSRITRTSRFTRSGISAWATPRRSGSFVRSAKSSTSSTTTKTPAKA
jgi:hypothetical protein